MAATARDLIKSGLEYKTVTVSGLSVEVRGLTVSEAVRFQEISSKTDDKILLFAHLIKMCCPAFSGFMWWPKRIRRKLAINVLLELANTIMECSGYGENKVDEAVKD